METTESVRVKYDVVTKRVEVIYGERRISIPGKHDSLDEAKAAAEAYARRYLGVR
jgi:hypothetical protein